MCEIDPSENITSQIKHGFYSNCMIEALKAKLKDWNNIKITYIPAKYNEILCPHFLWSDGKYDYDFGTNKYLKWYERIWFYGEIRKRNLGWNERWKQYRVSKEKINKEEHKGFIL